MSYVTPMNILARTVRSLRPLVSDPALYSMIRAVRRQKLTYLSRLALLDLCDAAQQSWPKQRRPPVRSTSMMFLA